MHRTASNEATLISEISKIVNEENLIILPRQSKILVSILHDKVCEVQAFPSLLPKGKFGYNAPRDILISTAGYFNKMLLNFQQYFASGPDYIFLPALCMSGITCVHQ